MALGLNVTNEVIGQSARLCLIEAFIIHLHNTVQYIEEQKMA